MISSGIADGQANVAVAARRPIAKAGAKVGETRAGGLVARGRADHCAITKAGGIQIGGASVDDAVAPTEKSLRINFRFGL